MRAFAFATNPELDDYFNEVVDVMMKDFGIPEDEALGRLNKVYKGYDAIGDTTLMHEWPKKLAYTIYYGPDQTFWKPGTVLTPLPYP
jgi:hypothetical protein